MKRAERLISERQWSGHRNFPGQALLSGSHEAFCRLADDIEERLRLIESDPGLPMRRRSRLLMQTGRRFEDWQWAMRSHERYEEEKLYPFLVHRRALDLAVLEDTHHALRATSAEVEDAFRTASELAKAAGARPGWPELRRQLGDYLETLLAHLIEEESLVIPPLLELSAAEFRRFSSLSIDELLSSG